MLFCRRICVCLNNLSLFKIVVDARTLLAFVTQYASVAECMLWQDSRTAYLARRVNIAAAWPWHLITLTFFTRSCSVNHLHLFLLWANHWGLLSDSHTVFIRWDLTDSETVRATLLEYWVWWTWIPFWGTRSEIHGAFGLFNTCQLWHALNRLLLACDLCHSHLIEDFGDLLLARWPSCLHLGWLQTLGRLCLDLHWLVYNRVVHEATADFNRTIISCTYYLIMPATLAV